MARWSTSSYRVIRTLAVSFALTTVFACSQASLINQSSGTSQTGSTGTTTYTESLLHSFSYGQGKSPGSVLISGGILYGVTGSGGSGNSGTVYKMGLDGSNYTVLHSFVSSSDGSNPTGLMISGSTIYGVATGGGSGTAGTIFSMGIDGSNFTVLHSFISSTDGQGPVGAPVLSGSTLYGVTSFGGSSSAGTLYSVRTDGTSFTVLYTFTYSNSNGAEPEGGLILSGTILYGVAGYGATAGTLYSFDFSNSTFTVLHSFTGADGQIPTGPMLLSGGVLYGMTYQGGASSLGTIFSYDTSSSTFTLLHSFTGATTDGASPINDNNLVLSGSVLYGITSAGGSSNGGTVFSYNTGTSTFTLLHSFANATDGSAPTRAIGLSGSTLYGATSTGGSGGFGTSFSVGTDGSSFTVLNAFSGGYGASPDYGSLVQSGSTLFGTASGGGSGGAGVIYSIGTDGSNYTVLHAFSSSTDGGTPQGGLTLLGSTLYGLTETGTSKRYGGIYSIGTNGTGFTLVHAFTGTSDGENPRGGLIASGSVLYGLTSRGGSGSGGTIFSYDTSSSIFTVLYSFSSASEGTPYGNLVLSGNVLYGTTSAGGTGSAGTIFSYNTSNSTFSVLHSFTSSTDGGTPLGGLAVSGSTLYGMTSTGGSGGAGTIYSYDTGSSSFAVLHAFSSSTEGGAPNSALLLSGSTLYGLTSTGGSASAGTLFRVGLDGSGFSVLHAFAGGTSDGKTSYSDLSLSGSTLYGTTNAGGADTSGTIFSLVL